MNNSYTALKTPNSAKLIASLGAFSRAASGIVTLIGCLALIGWIFDISTLKSVLPGWVTMKANTAIGLILSGTTLWLLHQPAKPSTRRKAQILAVISLLIGLLTLIQYGFNINLGIDQLFFKESITAVGTFAPGRMAPNTALNFLMLGSALLLLSKFRPNYLAVQSFTIVAFFIALLGFLGYLYNIQEFYGIGLYTKMAIHTAIAFMLLSISILLFQPDQGVMKIVTSQYAGGVMSRQLLLAVIGIPPILSWLILAGYRAKLYNSEIGLSLSAVFSILVFAIVIWMNARALEQMDTRRQQAEEQSRLDAIAAAQSAAYLTAVIDNLADGLLVTDIHSRITRFNPALLKMFGLRQATLIGQKCQDLFSSDLANLVQQTYGDAQEVFTAEIGLAGGRIGQALATAIFKHNAENIPQVTVESIGSVILIRDITAEKEIDRMKTDFISTVSHELRTPLTSVIGFAKLIKKKLEEDIFTVLPTELRKVQKTTRQVQQNINIIICEGERLTSLINDVLDIAKMEAGNMEWQMQPTSIEEVIDRAIAATSSLIELKGLTLIKDVQRNLPEVLGDRDRLIQVIINLISNAIKFTERGSITCRVSQQSGELVVSIIDTGIGIAGTDLDRVFEKFKQVGDTLTDKPKGTGLGLPICKQIIDHHNGKIWVESELNRGSTFSFTLPTALSAADEIERLDMDTLVRRLKQHVTTAVPTYKKELKTILVVDDDTNIRQLLRQELEAEGYQVREAKDGMDAIAQVKAEKPDLILLDVMMPQINGFDVAAVLRNDPQMMDIPIIILSIIENKERGFQLGIDRYFTKPVDMDGLMQEISFLISQGTSNKKVMVVDQNASALKILSDALQAQGYSVIEASDSQECIEKALSTKPDMIIVDSVFSQQNNLVKILRFERGLENVFFVLLEEEKNSSIDSIDFRF